jgi:hypothetical protein
VVHDREGFHWDGDGFWRRAVFDLDGIHHQSLSSRHNYFAVDAWDVERLGFGAALEVKRKERSPHDSRLFWPSRTGGSLRRSAVP